MCTLVVCERVRVKIMASTRLQSFMNRWADPTRPKLLPKETFVTLPWSDYWQFIGLTYQGFMNKTPEYVTGKIGVSNGYKDKSIEKEWYIKFHDGTKVHIFYNHGDPLLYVHGVDSTAITYARKVLF